MYCVVDVQSRVQSVGIWRDIDLTQIYVCVSTSKYYVKYCTRVLEYKYVQYVVVCAN